MHSSRRQIVSEGIFSKKFHSGINVHTISKGEQLVLVQTNVLVKHYKDQVYFIAKLGTMPHRPCYAR